MAGVHQALFYCHHLPHCLLLSHHLLAPHSSDWDLNLDHVVSAARIYQIANVDRIQGITNSTF